MQNCSIRSLARYSQYFVIVHWQGKSPIESDIQMDCNKFTVTEHLLCVLLHQCLQRSSLLESNYSLSLLIVHYIATLVLKDLLIQLSKQGR